MKSYSAAPDADNVIEAIRRDYHPDMDGVTVSALFVFDLEATDPVLKHQGYPAQAVVRITPIRDRALGMADANIVVDRSNWLLLSQRQRDALIDHELTHLTRALDKETEQPLCDVLDRPKLKMRQHDYQFGWFDEIAQRHGDASPEVRQARHLVESSGQLYFDFGPKVSPQRDTTHVHWQQGTNGELGNGPRCQMPADCVEIDPPVGGKSEAQQEALVQGEPAVAGTMPDVELPTVNDSADFEAGVAKALGARRKRGSNVIDGRSERVKHQDRQKDAH